MSLELDSLGCEARGKLNSTSLAQKLIIIEFACARVSMVGFEVESTSPITSSSGAVAQNAWSNSVTDESTTERHWDVGASITAGYGVGFKGEVTVTAAYGEKYGSKNTFTSSNSGFSSEDWHEATTVNPAQAGIINLRIKFENRGTAAGHKLKPTVNIILGDKTIVTYEVPEEKIIDELAVNQIFPEGSEWLVGDNPRTLQGMEKITLTLDELKSIALGVPIFLDIPQIDAEVQAQDEEGHWEGVDTWQNYKARIDGVCARISVDLGDGNMKDYRVFARSPNGPVVTLRDALEWTVGCEETSSGIEIMGATVGDWRIGFSQNAFNDVGAQLAERNILDVVLDAGWTITIKAPTGLDTPARAHYRIMDKTSEMCLEVDEGRTDDNVNVQINTWQNTDNQRWALEAVNDSSYVIIASHSGKCLDIDGSSEDNLASAIQNTTGDSASQRWILQPAASYPAVMPVRGTLEEHFIILNKEPGTCLDVKGISTDDGADVWQYSWWGGNNQRWELIPVGDGYFRICAKHSGLCLTIENNTLIQQSYLGDDSQKWLIKSNPDDFYYEIENKDSLMCLTSNESDTEVIQQQYIGGDNQKWQLIPAEQSWMNNLEVTYGEYSSAGEGWTKVGGEGWKGGDLNAGTGAGSAYIYLWIR